MKKNNFILVNLLKYLKVNFYDFILIFFCITPVWLLTDVYYYKYQSLFLLFTLSIIIIFFLNVIKNINLNSYFFFIIIIFFYGADSNLHLWLIFENLFSNKILNYFLSFVALIFINILLFKFLKKIQTKLKIYFL